MNVPDGGTPAEAVRAVQRWMALDLWMALAHDSLGFDAHCDSLGWAETWDELLAEVRDRAARATAAERQRWTRDVIVAAMAAKFGPHKAYNRATRTYEPDGNDAESTTMITFTVEDGGVAIRTLTYGEIADLFADLLGRAS